MVRMVLVGIPGVALYVVGIASLVLGAMPHSERIWALGGLAAIAVALPMALFGMGAWGRWRYLLAFAALPIVFAVAFVPLLFVVPQGEKGFKAAALIAFAAASLATYLVMRAVRASYNRARDRKPGARP